MSRGPSTIDIKCNCGKFQARAEIDPKVGNHLVCTCNSCQKYMHKLGRDDLLDHHGGTTLFQMAPQKVTFVSGTEDLKCMKLSPNGLLRWYAGCCKTPIANTVKQAKMPFVGIPTIAFGFKDGKAGASTLGPVRESVWGLHAKNGRPDGSRDKASFGFMMRSMRLLLRAMIVHRGEPSPFFDNSGNPICEPELAPR